MGDYLKNERIEYPRPDHEGKSLNDGFETRGTDGVFASEFGSGTQPSTTSTFTITYQGGVGFYQNPNGWWEIKEDDFFVFYEPGQYYMQMDYRINWTTPMAGNESGLISMDWYHNDEPYGDILTSNHIVVLTGDTDFRSDFSTVVNVYDPNSPEAAGWESFPSFQTAPIGVDIGMQLTGLSNLSIAGTVTGRVYGYILKIS